MSPWETGLPRINDKHDKDVAQEAIDQGLAKHVTGPELDDQLRREIESTKDPKHPSHHPWGCFKTCKGETRRLFKDAKKHGQQDSSNDPEQTEEELKRQWLGDLDMRPNTSGPRPGSDRPRVLIDGVDTSSPSSGR